MSPSAITGLHHVWIRIRQIKVNRLLIAAQGQLVAIEAEIVAILHVVIVAIQWGDLLLQRTLFVAGAAGRHSFVAVLPSSQCLGAVIDRR